MTRALLLLFIMTAVLAPSTGSAAEDAQGWELSLALGAGRSNLGTSYEHRFEPVVESQSGATGSAGHDLELDGEGGAAWRVGVRRMLSSSLGIQVLLGGADLSLGGEGSPLDLDLDYTSSQPPDYVPVPASFSSSTRWSDPDGEVDVDYLCLSLLTRARAHLRVQLGLSGGLTFFRARADFASLGYQTLWLGGHGVLFTEVYEIRVGSAWRNSVGGNLGGEIDVHLSDRLSVFGEVRAFFSPAVDVPLEPSEVVNRQRVVRELPLSDIENLVDLGSLEIDPSFVSLSAGFRITL